MQTLIRNKRKYRNILNFCEDNYCVHSMDRLQYGKEEEDTYYKHSDSCESSDSREESKYPDYCRTIKVHDANGSVKELVFPKALDLDRPKRARTTFSPEQLYHLEREFQRNQYLVGKERTDLARRMRLSETQVKVWFQNRRTKYKRDRVKEAEVRDSKAESIAACSILHLLQNQSTSAPCAPVPFLSPFHPYPYTGYSAT